MVLFKKKEESEISRIPPLPSKPQEQKERGLPALPKRFNEDLNRNIIKSAINEDFNSGEDYSESIGHEEGFIPSPPKIESQMNQEDYHKFLPKEEEQHLENRQTTSKHIPGPIEGPDSIFVRIDKFRVAKKELAGIKKDVLEVEAIINKINEIKSKEDNEVHDINLNLDNIKKKIGDIDSLVFDKV